MPSFMEEFDGSLGTDEPEEQEKERRRRIREERWPPPVRDEPGILGRFFYKAEDYPQRPVAGPPQRASYLSELENQIAEDEKARLWRNTKGPTGLGTDEHEADIAKWRAEDEKIIRATERMSGPEEANIPGTFAKTVYRREQLYPKSKMEESYLRGLEARGALVAPPQEYWDARRRHDDDLYERSALSMAGGAAVKALTLPFEYAFAPITHVAAEERKRGGEGLAKGIETAGALATRRLAKFTLASEGAKAVALPFLEKTSLSPKEQEEATEAAGLLGGIGGLAGVGAAARGIKAGFKGRGAETGPWMQHVTPEESPARVSAPSLYPFEAMETAAANSVARAEAAHRASPSEHTAAALENARGALEKAQALRGETSGRLVEKATRARTPEDAVLQPEGPPPKPPEQAALARAYESAQGDKLAEAAEGLREDLATQPSTNVRGEPLENVEARRFLYQQRMAAVEARTGKPSLAGERAKAEQAEAVRMAESERPTSQFETPLLGPEPLSPTEATRMLEPRAGIVLPGERPPQSIIVTPEQQASMRAQERWRMADLGTGRVGPDLGSAMLEAGRSPIEVVTRKPAPGGAAEPPFAAEQRPPTPAPASPPPSGPRVGGFGFEPGPERAKAPEAPAESPFGPAAAEAPKAEVPVPGLPVEPAKPAQATPPFEAAKPPKPETMPPFVASEAAPVFSKDATYNKRKQFTVELEGAPPSWEGGDRIYVEQEYKGGEGGTWLVERRDNTPGGGIAHYPIARGLTRKEAKAEAVKALRESQGLRPDTADAWSARSASGANPTPEAIVPPSGPAAGAETGSVLTNVLSGAAGAAVGGLATGGPLGAVLGGVAGAALPHLAARAGSAIKAGLKPPDPLAASLPAVIRTTLETTEAADPRAGRVGALGWLGKAGRITGRTIREFGDWAAGVSKEPGLGDVKGPNGENLSLQVSAKNFRGQQLNTHEQAAEAEAGVFQPMRSNADYVLARRVIDYRDLARQVRENTVLPQRQAAARATVARLKAQRRLTPEQAAELEQAEQTLKENPKGLYGHTPEEVRAVLRAAEAEIATNPAAQEAVAAFRRPADEIAADLREMGYKANKANWAPRAVIHPEVQVGPGEPSGAGGRPAEGGKRQTPRSALYRRGSEKFSDPDVFEGLFRSYREVKQAVAVHRFAKLLQESENNLVSGLLETGELPAGVSINDVGFWSFERNAPTITGVRAHRIAEAIKMDADATAELREAFGEGPEQVAQVIKRYTNGRVRPYGLYKKNIIEMLDGLKPDPTDPGLTSIVVRLSHDLFRLSTLALRGGLGYEVRNLGGDAANMTALASRWRDMPRDLLRGVVLNPLEFLGRRVREVKRGKADPVLERVRQHRAMQTGLFGSGKFEGRSLLNQLWTHKQGVQAPFRTLTPAGKIGRAVGRILGSPLDALRALEAVREAAPREATIQSLLREGYNEAAATVLGNQVLVDYSMGSSTANWARKSVSPYIAWTLQTTSNFLSHPVRSWKSVVPRLALAYAAWNAWNWIMHPDQERSLPPYLQAMPHLNTGGKDEHGRDAIIDLSALGMQVPIHYKLVAATIGRGLATLVGDEMNRDLNRIAWENARSGFSDVTALIGPLPGAGVIGLTGVDPRTMREVERDRDETLSDPERSAKNLERFGVPWSNTRAAAALGPFVAPVRTIMGLRNPDPFKAGAAQARFLGDPRRYVEPGARTSALRGAEQEAVLHAFADAVDVLNDPNATPEARDAARKQAQEGRARLIEMRTLPATLAQFIGKRRRERAEAALSPEERRRRYNMRNAPIEAAPPTTTPFGD